MKNKPKIGISSCLLGKNVRYNGGNKKDSWVISELSKFVDFYPVCPEVEMGLGTPREEIRLSYNEKTGERVLIFNDTSLVPVRTRRPFQAPFVMISGILKDQKCNNHFFLVSTRKVADFNFGTPSTGDIVRFA